MSDPRQQMLDQIGRDGWAGLDIDPQAQAREVQRMMAAAAEQTAPIARCLATPDGRYLLNWLLLQTVMSPPDERETHAASAEHYALEKKFRDGMNGVVFTLLKVVQVAHEAAIERADT